MLNRIFITGGAGYMGSRLVPSLIRSGFHVTVYDTCWFGREHLQASNQLKIIQDDIRYTDHMASALAGHDVVIHLACISNDPSVELDADLSKTINLDAFEPMVIAAKKAGVKRFIYASTSSVYGISDAPDVREDHAHVPLTLYNTYKSQCEPLLWKHTDDAFTGVIVRPSTHCGYAPRQRLDLAVNILTNLAVNKRVITVHGGAQKRPNIHIDDMVDCYRLLLRTPTSSIANQTFNVGAGNLSIMDLANIVQEVVTQEYVLGSRDKTPVTIETQPITDVRSYQVNSDKIRQVLGYKPNRTIQQAVSELCYAFRSGLLPDSLTDDRYFNVARMRKIHEGVYEGAMPTKMDYTKGLVSDIDVMHRGASV